jgi:hypothetical protein
MAMPHQLGGGEGEDAGAGADVPKALLRESRASEATIFLASACAGDGELTG